MAVSLNIRPGNKILTSNLNACMFGICQNSGRENYPLCAQKRNLSDECGKDEQKLCQCKVALVTGGGRGIGFHIAEYLLEAGAQAVILGDVVAEECDKATTCLNEKYGPEKALYQPCDVRNKGDMAKIFKCIKQRFGRIDIVVNNAGILADSRWEDTIDINIKGLVHGTLLGFEHMSTRNCGNGGIILNNASILGLQPFYPSPVYTGTKHFIIGFSRSMGNEYFYNQSKVKVMAFCPGVTDTRMIWDAKLGQLAQFGELGKEAEKGLASLPPQGPEECGKCVIAMIKAGENGSIWVSEGCENYKVNIPDRHSYKPKDLKSCPPKQNDDCKPKEKSHSERKPKEEHCNSKEGKKGGGEQRLPKEDPCKPKEDPCKPKKEDPCKPKKEDPCKPKKEDPCKPKKEDPCKPKEDPCKPKEDPCKPKEDPCKPKEDPCKPKEEPCKPKVEKNLKEEKSKPTEGKKGKEHKGDSKDPKSKESTKVEDPNKHKDDHSKQKEPLKKNDDIKKK